MIFAIDFDGTIVENKFPIIGAEITRTTDFIRKYIQDSKENQWILYTMREGKVLKEALDWLDCHDLHPDYVNDNTKELQTSFGSNPRKIYADFYIDDHNFTIPVEVPVGGFKPDRPVDMVRPSDNIPDAVNHPKHYTDTPFGLEVIEITDKYDFSVGNALKYILRAGKKGDAVEDLEKAVWYLNHKIELMKKNGSSVL